MRRRRRWEEEEDERGHVEEFNEAGAPSILSTVVIYVFLSPVACRCAGRRYFMMWSSAILCRTQVDCIILYSLPYNSSLHHTRKGIFQKIESLYCRVPSRIMTSFVTPCTTQQYDNLSTDRKRGCQLRGEEGKKRQVQIKYIHIIDR